MNTEIKDFLSLLKFLRYVRKYLPVIILSATVLSFLAYDYISTNRQYAASARFIVNNPPGTNTPETAGTDTDLREMRGNALQLFFSTEVINALIDKFDLYPCYRADRNNVFAKENLTKAVRASIQFKLDKVGGH